MICEVLPVVFQSAGAESNGHLLQPLIQPLCESHPTLFCQINPLIDIYVLAEFGGQFLLGISVDVAEDRIAVGLVPDHDAALPAAIFPLAYHAVAGWSALCHGLFLLSLENLAGSLFLLCFEGVGRLFQQFPLYPAV